jgi:hypothetical protein
MNPGLAEAVARGFKSQARVAVAAPNSAVTRVAFDLVDLESAHSISRPGHTPHPFGKPGIANDSALSARATLTSGDRRTVQLVCKVQAGSILWMRSHPKSTRKDIPTLWVQRVAVQRLHDISDEDAWCEGLRYYGPDASCIYAHLLEKMTPRQRGKWQHTDLHAEALARGQATGRECFALLWEILNSTVGWRLNPWVWVYHFTALPYDAEAMVSFAKSGAIASILPR